MPTPPCSALGGISVDLYIGPLILDAKGLKRREDGVGGNAVAIVVPWRGALDCDYPFVQSRVFLGSCSQQPPMTPSEAAGRQQRLDSAWTSRHAAWETGMFSKGKISRKVALVMCMVMGMSFVFATGCGDRRSL